MLYILTGRIQSGKTRWLQKVVAALSEHKIPYYGVLAPGIWQCDGGVYRKIGIENELMPSGTRVLFAQPLLNSAADVGNLGMQWDFLAEAVDAVNDHFSLLIKLRNESQPTRFAMRGEATRKSGGVLIVDELGMLELRRKTGITEAMRMLELGPCSLVDNAIIVVRESLLDAVRHRFDKWGETTLISPDDASWDKLKTLWQKTFQVEESNPDVRFR